MGIKLNLKIEAIFPDELKASATYNALKHEGNITGRSKSNIKLDKNKVVIEISAEDVVSLRAASNSYLRTLQAIDGISIDEEGA